MFENEPPWRHGYFHEALGDLETKAQGPAGHEEWVWVLSKTPCLVFQRQSPQGPMKTFLKLFLQAKHTLRFHIYLGWLKIMEL